MEPIHIVAAGPLPVDIASHQRPLALTATQRRTPPTRQCTLNYEEPLKVVSAIDDEWNLDLSSSLAEVASKFTQTWDEWSAADLFNFAVAPFFDPTP
jgi:hypothetical protein